MKVLHLIDHLGSGGSQRLLLDLLETRSASLEVEVVSLTDRVLPDMEEHLKRANVRWTTLGLPRRGPFGLAGLRRLLADRRPDLVHTHLDVSNFLGPACALSLGRSRPRLLLMIENDPFRHYSPPVRAGLRAMVSRADACLLVSDSLREAAAPLLRRARRVEVVPPGIDLERFGGKAADPSATRLRGRARRVVGSMGRLAPQKGFDLLVEAMPALLAAEPGTRVLIAGEGPERGRLERHARELGVDHALELVGYVEDPRAVFGATDVFVLPSRHEGFGLVFLEAMAMEVPVVGTRVVGIANAVRDGRTGILVPPEDPGALAEAILRLFAEPELRRSLVEEALGWVRRHGSRQRVTERTEALYAELCGTAENARKRAHR